MYIYRQTPQERVFNRCEAKIKGMCRKINFTTGSGGYNYSLEDVMQEARLKFHNEFEYYQNDEQYCRFVFIAVKNKMSNLRDKEKNQRFRFVAPTAESDRHGTDNTVDPYMRGLNQIKDSKTDIEEPTYYERVVEEFSVEEVLTRLKDEIDKTIVVCITSGKSIKETSKELSINQEDISKRLDSGILETINIIRMNN